MYQAKLGTNIGKPLKTEMMRLSQGGSLQHHTAGHPHAYSIMNAPWEIKDEPRFQ